MTGDTVLESRLAPSGRETTRPEPGMYRTVWRWHFYAGAVVAPLLVMLAASGAIFLYASEIDRAVRPGLHRVPSGGTPISAQARFDLAAGSGLTAGLPPASIEIPDDPARSTTVVFGGFDHGVRVFVDPYAGRVLGSLDSLDDRLTRFFRGTLDFHRRLFLGNTGRVLTELATGWTVLLLASGIYLWWPRRRDKVRGVWLVRWSAKPYTVLRDLHSIAGAALMPVALVIALTGHFYTLVWGTGARYTLGARLPARAPATAKKTAPAPLLALDRIVDEARRIHPGRNLLVALPAAPGGLKVTVLNNYDTATYGPMRINQLTFDPADGRLVSDISASSIPDRAVHNWTYPLHVGSFGGPATKVLWLGACLVLIALPMTGLWMWWTRRPRGRTGVPRRPAVRPAPWLAGAAVVGCTVMPMTGLSVLLILLVEGTVGFAARKISR